MVEGGYIKLHRSMLDWEWYKDTNTKTLFLHCLLKANWKPGRFQGVDVPTGSFVASYTSLSEETGLSERSIRTALTHLKATGELTVKRHPKFSVISIKNYCQYQSIDTRADTQATPERHPSDNNRRIERNKEGKNNMCESTHTEAQPDGLGEYHNVRLTDDELAKLQNYLPKDYERLINELSVKIKSEGSDYQDHYATIRRWADWERKKADRLPRGKPKKDDINDFMHSDDTEQEKELEQLFLAQAGKDRDKK